MACSGPTKSRNDSIPPSTSSLGGYLSSPSFLRLGCYECDRVRWYPFIHLGLHSEVQPYRLHQNSETIFPAFRMATAPDTETVLR